jgi:hypothetical protein
MSTNVLKVTAHTFTSELVRGLHTILFAENLFLIEDVVLLVPGALNCVINGAFDFALLCTSLIYCLYT